MPLSTDAAVINFAAFGAVITPAATDEFIVRQLDGVQRIETREQVHALEVGEHLVLPQVNEAATPTLAFGDGDSGFYERADDIIRISLGGGGQWEIDALFMGASNTSRSAIQNIAPSATVCGFVIAQNDPDTGIGANAADQLSLIAGGLELIRCVETGVAATDQVIIGPAGIIGATATPGLAFGDGDTGFYESVDDTLRITIGGTDCFQFIGATFVGLLANGPAILNEVASATNPTLTPNRSDLDTGVGHQAADNLSLIAGGLEAIRAEDPADLAATETSLWLFDLDNATIAQVSVGAAGSGGGAFKVLRIPN